MFCLFPSKSLNFTCLKYKSFENNWRENLLITSNFSFYHSVLYPFGELSTIFIKFKIVFCKLFQFGRANSSSLEESEICCLGTGSIVVLLYQNNLVKFTHSLIHHFEINPNSKNLQPTSEM